MQEYPIFHQQVGKSSGGHKKLCSIRALLHAVSHQVVRGGGVECVHLLSHIFSDTIQKKVRFVHGCNILLQIKDVFSLPEHLYFP